MTSLNEQAAIIERLVWTQQFRLDSPQAAIEVLGDQVDAPIRAAASQPIIPEPNVGELVRRGRHQSISKERFELLAADLLVRVGISKNRQELV